MADSFELTNPQPVPRGKEIWTFEGLLKSPLSFFPVRMTVIRRDKALLLVSSFPPEPTLLEELHKLGKVQLILAPNAMHCLWGALMRDACPGATLVGPPNALRRFPNLKWDGQVASPDDLVSGRKDLLAWTTGDAGNGWMQEIVLLHQPSKALIVTDLAFNFKRAGGETPLPGGLLGVVFRNTYLPLVSGYRPCCPTKPFGLLIGDAEAMSTRLAGIMEHDFDQVIMAHGDVVQAPGGKEAFRNGTVAFFRDVADRRRWWREWLGPSRAALAAGAALAVAAAAGLWRFMGT